MIEIAIVLVGSLVYGALQQQARARLEAWRRAATKLGLDAYVTRGALGQPSLRGTRAGHRVNVKLDGGGKRPMSTRFEIAFRDRLPFQATFGSENALTSLGRAVGIEDVRVGDADFDRAVLVVDQGGADALPDWLTDDRRRRILRFVRTRGGAKIEPAGLSWELPGSLAETGRLVDEVNMGIELAEALMGGARPAPPAREPEAASAPDAAPAERGGERPAPAQPGLDVDAVRRDLFDPADGEAAEAGARFEERYRGRSVAWSGTLLGVEEAALDAVFGDRPLARAVVLVFGPRDDERALDAVRAVVRLPAGSAVRLAGRVGGLVGFTGRLVAVDAFARNLYVDEGAVVDA